MNCFEIELHKAALVLCWLCVCGAGILTEYDGDRRLLSAWESCGAGIIHRLPSLCATWIGQIQMVRSYNSWASLGTPFHPGKVLNLMVSELKFINGNLRLKRMRELQKVYEKNEIKKWNCFCTFLKLVPCFFLIGIFHELFEAPHVSQERIWRKPDCWTVA